MIILGINWGDTATVSLMKNNKIISAYGEERFTRIKNDMSYPYHSIKQCLKDLGEEKIDYVALGAKTYSYESLLTHIYKFSVKEMVWLQNNYYYDLFYNSKKDLPLSLKRFSIIDRHKTTLDLHKIRNLYPKINFTDLVYRKRA